MKSILLLLVSSLSLKNISSFRLSSRLSSRSKPSSAQFSGHSSSIPIVDVGLQNFREKQMNTPRISFAEEVRTLIDQSIGFGVMSTHSVQFDGYPTGSVAGFQLDESGLPFFAFSTMSAHTTDILKDKRVSLTVIAKNFQGAAQGRVVLIGDVEPVKDLNVVKTLKEKYLMRHSDAYWVNFGYKFTNSAASNLIRETH